MPASLKYGRRPPKNTPALMLGPLLTGTVPPHPATDDNLARLGGGWQMLGNNVAGDCNAVTWSNMRRLITAVLATERYPSQAQVWQFYQTQNPGFDPNGSAQTNGPGSSHDQGMDVQTGLEYLQKHGGPDGAKVIAFAKVDHTNMAEVEAAVAIFGCLWLGIQVLEANQQQFSEGEPWTDVAGSQVDGSHAILGGGYDTSGVKFITWGAETEFELSFWNGSADGQPLVEEAWVAIWPEHLGTEGFEQGIDKQQLAADYHALTGKTLVLPQPAPAPKPTPAPADPDAALEAAARPWLTQTHTGADEVLVKALAAWVAAKGAATEAAIARHAEMIHATQHSGTFVPTLDDCPEHDRGDYENRVREMHSR